VRLSDDISVELRNEAIQEIAELNTDSYRWAAAVDKALRHIAELQDKIIARLDAKESP
jgi:hypothetical protein